MKSGGKYTNINRTPIGVQLEYMSTYTQILYHIIFGTKNHEMTLTKENRKQLFKYIWGILENKKCHLFRINGIENHLHILTHLHPSVSLADTMKDIKLASSKFIKDQHLFTNFNGWQEGYGAFTCSYEAKDNLINYIINQENHHKTKTFKEEYIELLKENNVPFDEKFLL